jgi:hypothetical protein
MIMYTNQPGCRVVIYKTDQTDCYRCIRTKDTEEPTYTDVATDEEL